MTRKEREKSLLKKQFIKFSTKPSCFSHLLYKFFTSTHTYFENNIVQCTTVTRTVDDCFLLIKYYNIPLDYTKLATLISFLRKEKLLTNWICITIHKRVHVMPYKIRSEDSIKQALKKCGIKNYKL